MSKVRTDTLSAIRQSASYGSPLSVRARRGLRLWAPPRVRQKANSPLAISSARFQFSDPPTSKLHLLEFLFVLLSGGDVLARREPFQLLLLEIPAIRRGKRACQFVIDPVELVFLIFVPSA